MPDVTSSTTNALSASPSRSVSLASTPGALTLTGKSCAVTLILQTVLERNPNGHILLLDPHNEYHHAFDHMANVIDIQALRLPFWMFSFAELREVLANAGARSVMTSPGSP